MAMPKICQTLKKTQQSNGNNHRNVLTWQQNLVVIPIVETCGEKEQEEEKLSSVQLLA